MENQTVQPKENTKNKGCGFSLVLLFILGFIILIGYFTAEDPQTTTETPKIQNAQSQTIQEQQIKTEKTKKKTWQTTSLGWTGSALEFNTPTRIFKMNNGWRIKWHVTPRDNPHANFSIKVYLPKGTEAYDLPIIWPIDTNQRAGTTSSYPPGTYLLKINALSVEWAINIEELK